MHTRRAAHVDYTEDPVLEGLHDALHREWEADVAVSTLWAIAAVLYLFPAMPWAARLGMVAVVTGAILAVDAMCVVMLRPLVRQILRRRAPLVSARRPPAHPQDPGPSGAVAAW